MSFVRKVTLNDQVMDVLNDHVNNLTIEGTYLVNRINILNENWNLTTNEWHYLRLVEAPLIVFDLRKTISY